MKNFYSYASVIAGVMVLSGCSSVNQALTGDTTNREMYHVFEIHTEAGIDEVALAVENGMKRNINSLSTSYPIPPRDVPDEPGRFEVEDAFEGSNLAALGVSLKVVDCDGSVWEGDAERDTSAAVTQVNACLWQHSNGYNLDMYLNVSEKDQGIIGNISSSMVEAALGDPEAWAGEIVRATTQEVHDEVDGAEIVHLEGRPELKDISWVSSATR